MSGGTYAQGFPIGLWDSAGTLLATTNAPASIPDDSYGFTPIAPVSLSAGQTYTIGVYDIVTIFPGGSLNFWTPIFPDSGQTSFDPAITFVNNVYDDYFTSLSAGLTRPTTVFNRPGKFGVQANFQFAPIAPSVPEPGSLALFLGLGAISSLLAVRRLHPRKK